MIFHARNLLIILFLSLSTYGSAASKLKDLVTLMEENDPRYKALVLIHQKNLRTIQAESQSFDLNLSVDLQQNLDNEPALSSSLSSQLPSTGSSLSISHSQSIDDEIKKSLSDIQLKQKVWNMGFSKGYDLNKSEIDKLVLKETLRHEEELEQYWFEQISLILKYNSLISRKKAYQNIIKKSQERLSYVKTRLKNAVARQSEVFDADSQLLAKKIEFQTIETELKKIRESLKSYINLELQGPVDLPLVAQAQQGRSRKEKIHRTDIQIAQIALEESKEAEKTNTSLYLGANRQTLGDSEDQSVYAGITIDLPIRNKTTGLLKAAAQASKESKEQNLKSFLSQHEAIGISLKEDLLASKNKIRLNSQNLKLLKKLLDDKWSRYKKGRISFSELSLAQERLEQAQIGLRSLEEEYHRNILRSLEHHDHLYNWVKSR